MQKYIISHGRSLNNELKKTKPNIEEMHPDSIVEYNQYEDQNVNGNINTRIDIQLTTFPIALLAR